MTTYQLVGIVSAMGRVKERSAKGKLIETATELIRRQGFVATSVDEICAGAEVTKGAFFHHFESKEALAEACLRHWDEWAAGIEAASPFQMEAHPVDKVLGYMDFFITLFENPKVAKSCLVGTMVQEVANSHPKLRKAAQECFLHAEGRLAAMLHQAALRQKREMDEVALAKLWIATLQGTLILAKASQDPAVISTSLRHLQSYIRMLLTSSP